jgi:hypothetical protein
VEPYGDLVGSGMLLLMCFAAAFFTVWVSFRPAAPLPTWAVGACTIFLILDARFSRSQFGNLLWALHTIRSRKGPPAQE